MIKNIKDGLINILEKINSKIQDTYSFIGEQSPFLIRQIDGNITSLNEVMQISNDETQDNRNIYLNNIIEFVLKSKGDVEALHDKEYEIFLKLENSINDLKDFERNLKNIKLDSIEMELISLNAMTIALKAGTHGKAFSYITEELKRLSNKTIQTADEITNKGIYILEEFYKLKSDLFTLKTEQDKVTKNFENNINNSLSGFNNGIETIKELAGKINFKTSVARSLILKIIQETQKQDIIKQPLEFIIASLKEFKDSFENEFDLKDNLDKLYFAKILPDFCKPVLDEVHKNIESSLAVFEKETIIIENNINSIEEEQGAFLEKDLKENNSESIDVAFKSSLLILENIILELRKAMQRKRQCLKFAEELLKEIKYLDNSFKRFNNLITRFHAIDVASRIEIAKKDILETMSGTVNEMTRLIKKIEKDVIESMKITNEFIIDTKDITMNYNKLFEQEEYYITEFESRTFKNYTELSRYKGQIAEKVKESSIFSKEFKSIFTESKSKLMQLNKIKEYFENINNLMNNLKKEADLNINRIMAENNIRTWDVDNEKFKEIINKFAIFTQKQVINLEVDFRIKQEADMEAGKVTLF